MMNTAYTGSFTLVFPQKSDKYQLSDFEIEYFTFLITENMYKTKKIVWKKTYSEAKFDHFEQNQATLEPIAKIRRITHNQVFISIYLQLWRLFLHLR